MPADARIGVNKVVLLGGGESMGSVNVTVRSLSLIVAPDSAVPGQQVTITGSDFGRSKDVTSIAIGGEMVGDLKDASSTSAGRITVTVAVPLAVGHGKHAVVLRTETGKVGEGMITVPAPSLTVSPDESPIASTITVSGRGFASTERVEVLYNGVIEEIGRTNSTGEFSLTLTVPSTAGVGETNLVEVTVRNQETITAETIHRTPKPTITVPLEGHVGSLITISGNNFRSFAVLNAVDIGGQRATPSPAPATDRHGCFEFQTRVPIISLGTHTVTVSDGDNSASESFTVITTAMLSDPEAVFGVLTDVLVAVWKYDNATGNWYSYSPANPPRVNDLTEVTAGDIIWVHLSEPATFQGKPLRAGWSLILLD